MLGLGFQLAQPRQARRGVWLAAVSLLLAGAMFSIPAGYRLGPRVPPIHDITTDIEDPPPFVAVVPLNTPGRTDYEGEVIAAQQRQAYPDLLPATLDVPPAEAFERALAAVYRMRWQLVEADEPAGRIEATDTTFWFGFKDDVVIRVRPAGAGSRIDVRSAVARRRRGRRDECRAHPRVRRGADRRITRGGPRVAVRGTMTATAPLRRGPASAARGAGVPASACRGFGAQPHLSYARAGQRGPR